MDVFSLSLGALALGVLAFFAGLVGLYFLFRYFATRLGPKPAANDD